MVTGEIVNTDWSSDSYDASRSAELNLHLIIDRDGLRYLIFDEFSHLVIRAGYFALVHEGISWLQQALEKLKTLNGFKKVICSSASLPFAVIPERFYNESLASNFLELSFGREFTRVKHQSIEGGLALISEDFSEWKNAVIMTFPNVRFDSLIQEMYQFTCSASSGKKKVMAVQVSDTFMELCICHDGILLFAGFFETRSAEDILYFIGLSAAENKMNNNEDLFVISGAEEASMDLLKKYFNRVSPPQATGNIALAADAGTDAIALCEPFFFKEL